VPWHVAKSDTCPVAKPWAVIKDSDGTVDGRCHPTKARARRQMAALYSSEQSRAVGLFLRSFPLEDIRILTRAQGAEYADGRTVEAYAAVFDREAEIRDFEGHYKELIDRVAFNKAISDAKPQGGRQEWRVGVFYNHGLTIHGTPSDRFSVPLGVPIDIRAEDRGLLTVTRYNLTPLAEEILEAIRSGSVTAQSFTGKIVRSDPTRPPAGGYKHVRGPRGGNAGLPVVRRLELGLREYGPTPFPAYADAAVVGVRSLLAGLWPGLSLSATPTDDPDGDEDIVANEADPEPAADGTPPDDGAAADEPPSEQTEEHSSRHEQLVSRIRAARERQPGLGQTPRTKVQERAAEIVRSGSKEPSQ
jgi:HK97 family phage prohead protease